MIKSPTTVAWLAGLNAFVSGYALWTYYRALQYATQSQLPLELHVLQIAVLCFECISLGACAYFLWNRTSEVLKKVVLLLCTLQLLALFITPFLISAVVWPRVM